MFTGLIETTGIVREITTQGANKTFLIESNISSELTIDQSVSHNGVCLTVTAVKDNIHTVTAINETLIRSTLGDLKEGYEVNIERCLLPTQRLDGHIVQGHVDGMGKIIKIEDADGSLVYTIEIDEKYAHLIIEKGSIAVDGVSLTIVSVGQDFFSVAIIPHTSSVTIFKHYEEGSCVNLEFDIVGKYLSRYKEIFMDRA